MVASQKKRIDLPPVAAGVLLGTSAGVMFSMILSGALAWIISAEHLAQESIGYGVMVILLASSAVGSLAGVNKSGQKRLVTAALTGGCYYLVMVVMNILFFEGRFDGMGETALVVMAGSGLVILAGLKGERTGKKRAKNFKFR